MVRTGYGVVERAGSQISALSYGIISLGSGSMEGRLARLYTELSEITRQFGPTETAIEGIFQSKNARSALVLGHARGVALLVAGLNQLPVFEYAPAEVKRAVTCFGRAEKSQVQKMVAILLGLPQLPPVDAADALAIAICHAQTTRARVGRPPP
ncbi:MAG: crossover junction endodeoxyribonuclease RuvC [Bradymonadales bacterium]|nr:crossover junction endodeoxyribonuclease RuvC [Bradymonadales bacterium]